MNLINFDDFDPWIPKKKKIDKLCIWKDTIVRVSSLLRHPNRKPLENRVL